MLHWFACTELLIGGQGIKKLTGSTGTVLDINPSCQVVLPVIIGSRFVFSQCCSE